MRVFPNNVIAGFLSAFVFFASNSYATENIVESCVTKDSDTYFPVGDERGRSVLTRFEVNRDCNITKTVQGACLEWETKHEKINMKLTDYDVYRSSNNEGAIGSFFGMVGAYDQIEHLWSGWKGYCETGTKTDFSWAADPMFWASQVASMAMSGSAGGDAGASAGASAGANAGASAGETTFNQSIQKAGEASSDALVELGKQAGVEMTKATAKCSIAAGVDFATDLYSYMNTDKTKECDPIDEFCGETESEKTQESDIFTLDRIQYEDIIEDNPQFADYIVILDEQDDILTCRYKKSYEMEGMENMSQEELEAMQEKMRTTQLQMSMAVTTAKLASCVASDGAVGDNVSTAPSSDDGRLSVKDGLSTAISAIPAEWLGPYGALIKVGLQVCLEFATSFKDIDTCHNKEDATQAGSRHEKTQESLPYDLCHLVDQKCVQKDFWGKGCGLEGFDYCCYDQILTKVLVEQLKAQLGRDWAHCTGITLRDLNYVSFRQCTDAEMHNGFDGSKKIGIYNPQGSFQYINKCIDLTEFKDFLQAQIGEEIDMSDFDRMFDDMKAEIN